MSSLGKRPTHIKGKYTYHVLMNGMDELASFHVLFHSIHWTWGEGAVMVVNQVIRVVAQQVAHVSFSEHCDTVIHAVVLKF